MLACHATTPKITTIDQLGADSVPTRANRSTRVGVATYPDTGPVLWQLVSIYAAATQHGTLRTLLLTLQTTVVRPHVP